MIVTMLGITVAATEPRDGWHLHRLRPFRILDV